MSREQRAGARWERERTTELANVAHSEDELITSTASHLCHALRLFGSSSGSSWTWYASAAMLPSVASSESLGSACACARFSTSASSRVIVSELSADMGGEWYRGTTGRGEKEEVSALYATGAVVSTGRVGPRPL